MDAVTGLSGSGPGYAFFIIEALVDAGVRMGLAADVALKLSAQSLLGAARLCLKGEKGPAEAQEHGDFSRWDDAPPVSRFWEEGSSSGDADRGRGGSDAPLRGAGRPEIGRAPPPLNPLPPGEGKFVFCMMSYVAVATFCGQYPSGEGKISFADHLFHGRENLLFVRSHVAIAAFVDNTRQGRGKLLFARPSLRFWPTRSMTAE